MAFILDAIKGCHAERSEDRLTQVFCACFNNSRRFREMFLRFIGQKTGAGQFRARTQEQYAIRGTFCRADILIGKPGDQPSIVIENKIEAPLTAQQLKTYNRVSEFCDARKLALVKHYFEMESVPDWAVLHWADFHSELMASRSVKDPIDSFVLGEFVQLLEELGMARALEIKREQLRELAKFMKVVREPKRGQHLGSVTPFETASDYLGMLEDIVDQMHEEPLLRKRLGKQAKFSPWLAWWWEDKAPEEPYPWLGVEIRLRKTYKGIASISTGILFNSTHGSLTVQTYTSDESGNFLKWVIHKGNLHFDSYTKRAFAFWKQQLQ